MLNWPFWFVQFLQKKECKINKNAYSHSLRCFPVYVSACTDTRLYRRVSETELSNSWNQHFIGPFLIKLSVGICFHGNNLYIMYMLLKSSCILVILCVCKNWKFQINWVFKFLPLWEYDNMWSSQVHLIKKIAEPTIVYPVYFRCENVNM